MKKENDKDLVKAMKYLNDKIADITDTIASMETKLEKLERQVSILDENMHQVDWTVGSFDNDILYYSNKFPDIADLCMVSDEDIDDTVRDMREVYARKALLLFYPFRDKQDLFGKKDSLWIHGIYDPNNTVYRIYGVLGQKAVYRTVP